VSSTRSLRFAPDAAVLVGIRRFAADAAHDLGCSVDRDDLLLLVGELAANAALHQRGEAEITISRTHEGGVRIEVFDTDPCVPKVVRHQPWDAEGHRGLFLVEAISEDWGVEERTDGKVVWARIPPVDQRVD
jgi:anti-sigma regulatory factor (Ser/Thr protein kinase)